MTYPLALHFVLDRIRVAFVTNYLNQISTEESTFLPSSNEEKSKRGSGKLWETLKGKYMPERKGQL